MAEAISDPRRAWVERVLGIGFGTATTLAPTPSPGPGGPGVAFTKARLAWDATRKRVQAELQKLEASVLSECAEEPDFAAIKSGAKVLYTVLEFLDERLIDKLDEALNANPGPDRHARAVEAREIIGEYVDYLKSDAMLQAIDDNGFVPIAIGSTVTTTLQAIDGQLRAA